MNDIEDDDCCFSYEEIIDETEDEFGYSKADEARDREFRIREQALGAAMELNGRHNNPTPFADMVIADAEKFAAFLRGTVAASTSE